MDSKIEFSTNNNEHPPVFLFFYESDYSVWKKNGEHKYKENTLYFEVIIHQEKSRGVKIKIKIKQKFFF